MNEEIRPIPGHEGRYSVTSSGRVWSHDKWMRHPTKTMSKRPGQWLTPGINNGGYLFVILMDDGRRITARVHRLVAAAFLPNPAQLPEVNHINGDRLNNAVQNLEWCTPSQNQKHAHRNGCSPAQLARNHRGARSKKLAAITRRLQARADWISEGPQPYRAKALPLASLKSANLSAERMRESNSRRRTLLALHRKRTAPQMSLPL